MEGVVGGANERSGEDGGGRDGRGKRGAGGGKDFLTKVIGASYKDSSEGRRICA